jgi:methionyl-tRNA formyltransferase
MANIVFFGSSPFSVVALEQLINNGKYQIVRVVTKPDQPVGRHMELHPNRVKVTAEKFEIPVTDQLDNLPSISSDAIGLVAAYGKIIPQTVLDTFSGHIYNIHPSLLPKYRGASPLQQQILDGITETGVSIIQLDAEMDHGPIVAQENDVILSDDTWITLGNRLFTKGADLFLNSDLTRLTLQNHTEATFTKKITRQDGFVPWEEFHPDKLNTKLRAFAEWPGVWTLMPDGKRLKLISVSPVTVQIEGKNPQSWPY